MSEENGEVREPLDVPPTRKQTTSDTGDPRSSGDPTGDPPQRISERDLHAPLSYPDDGPLATKLRAVDALIGSGEKIALVAALVFMVVAAAADALADKLAGGHVELKEHAIIFSTFFIAMVGTAYATQQTRSLAMDLVSRRISARARLFLKVVLALFTIFILVIVINAGNNNLEGKEDFPRLIAWLIPIGGGLVIFHTVLHLLIDVDYIIRRKTPPERIRSGH